MKPKTRASLPDVQGPDGNLAERGAQMRVMIVEDNREMRRMIASLIDDLAPQAVECGDGAEVVAAYREHRPDWVLMDIEMREVNGLEATRRLRATFPAARIVIVTDYDYPEFRAAAEAAGACGYVLKDNLLELREILTG
jgi:CheY-like chemotaxis protein